MVYLNIQNPIIYNKLLQNHKLCSIINMKKEEKTDVEAVSLFSKNSKRRSQTLCHDFFLFIK